MTAHLPVLKLSETPTVQDHRPLFEKFTNPASIAGLDIGTVTASFEQVPHSLKFQDGLFKDREWAPKNFNTAGFMDPAGKLKSLIEQGKITKIHGNSTVEAAKVILLDDSNHLDKGQKEIRGMAANVLKGKVNVYLCEGEPSSKLDFSSAQIEYYFGPHLQLHQKGSKDYLSGCDDEFAYKESKQKVIQAIQQFKLSLSDTPDLRMIKSGVENLNDVLGEKAHQRTEAIWRTIQEKRKVFPDAKIMVFGGQGHLSEKWLHDQLFTHQIPFVEITFPEQEPKPGIEQVFNYYNSDEYSLWGQKKQ